MNLRGTPTCLIFLGVLFSFSAFSQQFEWVTNYGYRDGDLPVSDISVDGQSNVIVSGFAQSLLFEDYVFDTGNGLDTLNSNGSGWGYYIAKFDSSGNYGWSGHLGAEEDQTEFSHAATSNGGIYAAGMYRGATFDLDPSPIIDYGPVPNYGWGAFIERLNPDGTLDWLAPIGYVSDTVSIGQIVIERIKCEVDGNDQVYMTGSYVEDAIEVNPLGASVVLPASLAPEWVGSHFLSSYDANGILLWAHVQSEYIMIQGITGVSDGAGVVMTIVNVSMVDSVDVDPGLGVTKVGPREAAVCWYDQNGVFQKKLSSGVGPSWTVVRAYTNEELLVRVGMNETVLDSIDLQPGAGTVFVYGYGPNSSVSYYLAKYNTSLALQWFKPYASTATGDFDGNTLIQLQLSAGQDSIAIVTAEAGSVFAKPSDLAFLDANGDYLWVREYEPYQRSPRVFDEQGNLYVKGGGQGDVYDPAIDYDFWSDSVFTYPANVSHDEHNYIAKYSYVNLNDTQDSNVSVIELSANRAVPVCYPNPAGDRLTVRMPSKEAILSAVIFDVSGRVQSAPRTQKASGQLTYDVQAMEPGVYIIMLETEEGLSKLRFVKN